MALTKIPSELSSTTGIVDNSNATAITIDSNENVGIGTSSPNSYSGYTALTLDGTTGSLLDFEVNGSFTGEVFADVSAGIGIQAVGSRNIDFRTNNTDRMVIDASGRVTTPSQPAFSVGGDGTGWNALTNASSNSVINTWHSGLVTQRGGSNFNASTGKFTAPVTGYYMFIFSSYTRVPNPSTYNYIYPRFLLNGSNYGFSGHILHYQNHGDADLGSQISAIIPLATNDWVSATFLVNGTGDFHANSQRFEGYLIG